RNTVALFQKNHRPKYQCKDPIRQLLVLQLLLEAERDFFLNSVHTTAIIRQKNLLLNTRSTMLRPRHRGGAALYGAVCSVNETLLDIEFPAPLFQRLFGDRQTARSSIIEYCKRHRIPR